MNRQDILNNLAFLDRVPVTGQEAYVLVDLMEKLRAMLEEVGNDENGFKCTT